MKKHSKIGVNLFTNGFTIFILLLNVLYKLIKNSLILIHKLFNSSPFISD